MAIRNIKEIINNKGYVINPSDRKIFEREDLQSFFGLSSTDAIEFIIYDINDNQLPQYNGELVRYIPLTTENINDYFLVPEGTIFQKYKLPKEYFIDVERLLKEAGYSNGIFKTQVILINKRCGTDQEFNKLWISEISPSRTEVRLFPLKKGVQLFPELQTRYNIFVNDGDFREDTIQSVFRFLEKVTPMSILGMMVSKYGQPWVDKLKKEFGIDDFDLFMTNIHSVFMRSAIYEFTNRISDIHDLNYGNPKPDLPPIELSKRSILNTVKEILATVIEKYLPVQNIQLSSITTEVFDESIDPIYDILQSYESDLIIDTSPIIVEETVIVHEGNVEQEIKIEKVVKDINDNPDINTDVKIPVITPDIQPDYVPTTSVQKPVLPSSGGSSTGTTFVPRVEEDMSRPEVVNSPRPINAQQ